MHTPPVPAAPARFITFEGVDGAGKSTQLEALAEALQQRGVDFVRTREPGGTPLGESLRALVLGQSMSAVTETLLMFAARREHLEQVIVPALGKGQWVLCDRFTDASYAYQGAGRGVGAATIEALAGIVQGSLAPDLTILVDIDPQVAQQRRARVRAADRFESEAAVFFARVRIAYMARAAADPGRFLVLDGAASRQNVTAAIVERLLPWLR